VRSDTGEVVGYSQNKWKAMASVRIRYEKTYGYVPEEFASFSRFPSYHQSRPRR
jgi:hypothetical protein